MKTKLFKKAGSAVLAAALALNASSIGGVFVSAEEMKYEFEDAEYTSDITLEDTGLYMQDSGTITLTVNMEAAGTYDLIFYAYGVGGAKQQNVSVNGGGILSLSISEADDYVACELSAVKLNEGENTIVITKSWGWSKFDCLVIEETVLPEIKAYDTVCSDPDIIPEAQNLMNYMASVYGEHIISGQQEIYKYAHHDFEYEFEYINDLTGEYPAIRGFDYLNEANILYGSEDGTTDRIIDWVNNRNGIATASWHITVPKDFASYTLGDTNVTWETATYAPDDTDFDTSQILVEGTKEREYWMAALDKLAQSLQKLEDANVPLIFRPLHEAEGGGGETGSWFFWGQDGSEVYKGLWQLTYNTLVNDYGLHNLIWEWNSYNFDTSASWYPGEEYVDIIGYDKYSCTDWSTGSAVNYHNDSSYASTFYGIMEKYNSTKMVAMAENDSFSTLENITGDKAGWLYFCTWYDGGSDNNNFLSNPLFNTEEDTITMYQSDYCITLDELPATLYSEEIPTDPTEVPPTTEYVEPTTDDGSFTFELMKESVDLSGREEGKSYELVVTISGAATASIGGGLGFGTSSDDWTNLEWSGNADSDGNLVVTIPLDDVSTAIESGELQVWWSNVWDAVNEVGIDQPCEIVSIEMTEAGEEPTEDVPTTDSEDVPTTGGTEATLYGDVNESGEVEIADAILIMAYAANGEAYPLTAQQLANGDVYQSGDGVGVNDAVSIQKYITKIITKLPESYMD